MNSLIDTAKVLIKESKKFEIRSEKTAKNKPPHLSGVYYFSFMKTIIRKGVKEDLPSALELIKELANYEKSLDEVTITLEDLENDGFGDRPWFWFLVAEDNNRIIGLSFYWIRYSTWKGKFLFLEDFVIKKEYRRSGIGSKLFEETIKICKKHNLHLVEDACPATGAEVYNKKCGTFGIVNAFSMHPLKNLNVWGDGGMIVTNDKNIYDKLSLLRNHGLRNRDICEIYGYNSRLDTLQAIVGNHYIKKIDHITDSRILNAQFFDRELSKLSQISIPKRTKSNKQVFHIYVIRVKERDELQRFLINNGIDAKIHYPIPMHLQPASKEFGYSKGDFPLAEKICQEALSLPVHEFISAEQREYILSKIKDFYS